jgi:hypothetical protein
MSHIRFFLKPSATFSSPDRPDSTLTARTLTFLLLSNAEASTLSSSCRSASQNTCSALVSQHIFPRQISSRAVLFARACLKKFHRSSPESSRSTTNPRKLCVLPKTFWRTTSGSKATTKRRPVSLRVHHFARNTFRYRLTVGQVPQTSVLRVMRALLPTTLMAMPACRRLLWSY